MKFEKIDYKAYKQQKEKEDEAEKMMTKKEDDTSYARLGLNNSAKYEAAHEIRRFKDTTLRQINELKKEITLYGLGGKKKSEDSHARKILGDDNSFERNISPEILEKRNRRLELLSEIEGKIMELDSISQLGY